MNVVWDQLIYCAHILSVELFPILSVIVKPGIFKALIRIGSERDTFEPSWFILKWCAVQDHLCKTVHKGYGGAETVRTLKNTLDRLFNYYCELILNSYDLRARLTVTVPLQWLTIDNLEEDWKYNLFITPMRKPELIREPGPYDGPTTRTTFRTLKCGDACRGMFCVYNQNIHAITIPVPHWFKQLKISTRMNSALHPNRSIWPYHSWNSCASSYPHWYEYPPTSWMWAELRGVCSEEQIWRDRLLIRYNRHVRQHRDHPLASVLLESLLLQSSTRLRYV